MRISAPWILGTLLAGGALAQDAGTEPPPVTEAAPVAPAPAPAAKPPPATSPTVDRRPPKLLTAPGDDGHGHGAAEAPAATEQEAVLQRARHFFSSLLLADARSAVEHSAFPFFLEGTRFDDPDALQLELLKHVRAKRTDLLVLYGIEVLTPAQMEEKYGKRPDRLANLPLKDKATYLAVANLSGHAAVVVYKPMGTGWRAVAYHD